MAKQKSLEQLRAEKEQVEKRLAQEQHKLERLENRNDCCAASHQPASPGSFTRVMTTRVAETPKEAVTVAVASLPATSARMPRFSSDAANDAANARGDGVATGSFVGEKWKQGRGVPSEMCPSTQHRETPSSMRRRLAASRSRFRCRCAAS